MYKNYLTPQEITEYTIEGGYEKVKRNVLVVFLLGIMAGVYIALGAFAASVAAHDILNKGVSKLVTGAVFPVGLMFVVINGADLFTGNSLIAMSTYEKRTTMWQFIKNLGVVLAGNFIGALLIAYLVANTSLLTMSENRFGAYVIKVAVHKTNLPFKEVFFLAILCNLFVCSGVWMMYAAKDIAGKVLAGFFPIFAFAISGAEHIVANMYYIPLALFSKTNLVYIEGAHVTTEHLNHLTWSNFLVNNALPVTLGNTLGGIFIATMYYFIFKKLPQTSK
ncbi:formate/nitrite transporter family protein [Cellulosilyticum sp. I15G10I2]|uniref:formate/nitrite transporter family protein n=1 Tax=Cellulosilyticum sp. I15G10I2 TaxID=1892843 RepID=UPI00085BB912|nr:formate/nitrite transporter family protein [Cellulosilyticum sp. I15G10I2]